MPSKESLQKVSNILRRHPSMPLPYFPSPPEQGLVIFKKKSPGLLLRWQLFSQIGHLLKRIVKCQAPQRTSYYTNINCIGSAFPWTPHIIQIDSTHIERHEGRSAGDTKCVDQVTNAIPLPKQTIVVLVVKYKKIR